jgi:hypothetical protein
VSQLNMPAWTRIETGNFFLARTTTLGQLNMPAWTRIETFL